MKLRAFAASVAIALASALAIALFAAQPASSQTGGGSPTVYNVEIVIFRTNQALGGPENWSAQASRDFNTDGETANAARNIGQFVSALPASSYQLTPLVNKLRSTGLYVPVAHAAWSQTASDWGTRAGFPVERLGINVPGLSGNVFLERGQFLHLGMSLTYAPDSPPPGMAAGPGTTFNLTQSRRIRFYERNYYDHPGFGVIALVTPASGGRPAGR